MPTKAPVISVVLPVYNGEHVVGDAIHSILAQTYENWELIILDDGSQDGSLELCRSFAQKDSRISVNSNGTNKGLAASMNTLIGLTKGEYIAVQEQDDYSVPERIKWEVELLQSRPEIGCVSGIAAWLNDKKEVFSYFPGLLMHGNQYPQDRSKMVEYLYVEQCKVVNAGCAYRRSILKDLPGPYDVHSRMSIDWQFFLHLAHHHRIFGIQRVLVRMRRGKKHRSLTKMKQLQFQEARRCISLIYQHYRHKRESPINYFLFRKAMANQIAMEARYNGGIKGLLQATHAITLDPFCKSSWFSLSQISIRGIIKAGKFFKRLEA